METIALHFKLSNSRRYYSSNEELMPGQSLTSCCRTLVLFLGCSLILLFLSGCRTQGAGYSSSAAIQGNGAQVHDDRGGKLSLFLNLKKTKGSELSMTIQSIAILTESNNWIALLRSPVTADSRTLPLGQLFLGRSALPVGYYSRLRITTLCKPPGSETEVSPVTTELAINQPLYVARGDSHSLFILWDIGTSLAGDTLGKPALSLASRLKNMLVDVAYAACPDINTVFMICTDKNIVCDSLGVTGGPTYLISDPTAPTANLFALTENDIGIKKIGPAANRVEENFPLSMLGKGLQFTTSPDSRWAFVVDRKRGNIVRLNLRSGAIDLGTRLGYQPSYIVYLEQQRLLAVTLSKSQSVVLLDPETMNKVQTISTGNKPEGLLLYRDNYLYIAESGGNSVMVYDLSKNMVQQRIQVDFSPARIFAVNNTVYVANKGAHSISIIRPGQLNVSQSIRMDGPPLEFAYSAANKWLYVGNEAAGAIDIIDPMSKKLTGRISLGAVPRGMAVLHR